MGLNINIRTKEGVEHPLWDWSRHSGDREVFVVLDAVGSIDFDLKTDYVGEFIYRPKDNEIFRKALFDRIEHNHDRWNELCDILSDEKWWLYFGY